MVRALRSALPHADVLVQRHPNVPQYGLARMHVLHKLGHVLTHSAKDAEGLEGVALLAESKCVLKEARNQIRPTCQPLAKCAFLSTMGCGGRWFLGKGMLISRGS